jgi:hypothetical protein
LGKPSCSLFDCDRGGLFFALQRIVISAPLCDLLLQRHAASHVTKNK